MAARDVEDGAKELGRKLKGGAKKMAVRPAPRPPPPPRAPPGGSSRCKQTLDSWPGQEARRPNQKRGGPRYSWRWPPPVTPPGPHPPTPSGGSLPPPPMLRAESACAARQHDATDGRLVAPCTNARIGGLGPPEGAE